MEFNLDLPPNQFFIRSMSEEGIRVGDDIFSDSLIISGERIIPEWNVNSIEQINEASLQLIFDLKPEVVLIGTGKTQKFMPTATQVHFFRRDIGFEVMTTDAACRTFNVLIAEGRRVVAALIPLIL